MKRPPWYEEAKRLIDSGRSLSEAARAVKRDPSNIAAWFSPNALAYQLKYSGDRYLRSWGYDKFPGVEEVMERIRNDPFLKEDLEAKMSDRNFEDVRLFNDGQHRSGKTIKCAKNISPKCRKKEDFFNSSGTTSPVHARKAFQIKGWVVGGGPKADICPECFALMTQMRREKLHKVPEKEPAEPAVIVEAFVPPPPQPVAAMPLKVEPMLVATRPTVPLSVTNTNVKVPTKPITVKDVDRTAKRLIDAALDKHYFSERGGYVDAFSDEKIAQDLNCPTEWVAAVREEFFGPNTSALNLQEEFMAIEALAKDVKEAEKRVAAAMERMANIDKITNEVLADFEKKRVVFQDAFNKTMAKVKGL